MTLCTLLHGAGSSPEFIRRTFGPAVTASGATLVAPDVRGATMEQMVAAIAETDPGPGDVIGGVSLGAHAAALFAARHQRPNQIYAVMPAWIGAPGEIASLTDQTAAEIERTSTAAVLDRLATEVPGDWVVAELATAWTSLADLDLVEALRTAAAQPAPDETVLAQVRARAVIVALADDPTHPLDVATRWAEAIPDSFLLVQPRDLGGRDSRALADPLVELLSASL